MVDTIFADVAQPDQARIVAINAHNFLKNGGHFVISIKVCRKMEQDVHFYTLFQGNSANQNLRKLCYSEFFQSVLLSY